MVLRKLTLDLVGHGVAQKEGSHLLLSLNTLMPETPCSLPLCLARLESRLVLFTFHQEATSRQRRGNRWPSAFPSPSLVPSDGCRRIAATTHKVLLVNFKQ